jgi:hypothetical protein
MPITRDEVLDGNHDKVRKEVALGDDRRLGSHEKIVASINILNPERLPWVQGLHVVWQEFCSLIWRIGVARKNNWYRYGISLEPSSERRTLQSSLRHKYRHARICGIRKLCSIHPAPSPADFYILVHSIGPPLFQEDDQEKAERG